MKPQLTAMALSLSLPAVLDNLISALAPGPPYFDSDLSSIQAGNHCVATAQLSHALLRESYDVQSVAITLWDAFLDSGSPGGEPSDIRFFLDAFTVETTDLRGSPLVLSVAHPDIWQTLASLGERSESIKRVIVDWADKWFRILLLPGEPY